MPLSNGSAQATGTMQQMATLQAELLRLRGHLRNVKARVDEDGNFPKEEEEDTVEVPVGSTLHPFHSRKEQPPSLKAFQSSIQSIRAGLDSFLEALLVEQQQQTSLVSRRLTNGAAEVAHANGSSNFAGQAGSSGSGSGSSQSKARISSLLREQSLHLSTIDVLTNFAGSSNGNAKGKGKVPSTNGFLPPSLATCALDHKWLFARDSQSDGELKWPTMSRKSANKALQALIDTIQGLAMENGLEALAEAHGPVRSSPSDSNAEPSNEADNHLYTLTLAASIFVIDIDFGLQKANESQAWGPKLRTRISYATDSGSGGAGPSSQNHEQASATRMRDEGLCSFVHRDIEALGHLLFGLTETKIKTHLDGDATTMAIAHSHRLRKTIAVLHHLDELSSRRLTEATASSAPDLFAAMDDLAEALDSEWKDAPILRHAGSPYSTLVYHPDPLKLEKGETEQRLKSASLQLSGEWQHSLHALRFSIASCPFPLNGDDGGDKKVVELGSIPDNSEGGEGETKKEPSLGTSLRFLARLDPPIIVPRCKARKIAARVGILKGASPANYSALSPTEASLASALFSTGGGGTTGSTTVQQAPSAVFATTSPASSQLINSAMLATYSGQETAAPSAPRASSQNGSQVNGSSSGDALGNVGSFSFHLGSSLASSLDAQTSQQPIARIPAEVFQFERILLASTRATSSVSECSSNDDGGKRPDFRINIRTTIRAEDGEQDLQGLEIDSIPFDSIQALKDVVGILKNQVQINKLLCESVVEKREAQDRELYRADEDAESGEDDTVNVEVTYELQEDCIRVVVPVRIRAKVEETLRTQVWIASCRLDVDEQHHDGWKISEANCSRVGNRRHRRSRKDRAQQGEGEDGVAIVADETLEDWSKLLESVSYKGKEGVVRLEALARKMYEYVDAKFGYREEAQLQQQEAGESRQLNEDAKMEVEMNGGDDDIDDTATEEAGKQQWQPDSLESVIEEEDEEPEEQDASTSASGADATAAAESASHPVHMTRRASQMVDLSSTTSATVERGGEKETHARRPSTASTGSASAGTKRRASQSLEYEAGPRRTSRRKS